MYSLSFVFKIEILYSTKDSIFSSITIFLSYFKTSLIAVSNSSFLLTVIIPIEDPKVAGLIISG